MVGMALEIGRKMAGLELQGVAMKVLLLEVEVVTFH